MPKPLQRIAVGTHLHSEAAHAALADLTVVGRRLGLELLMPEREATKHPDSVALGFTVVDDTAVRHADLCLVFGGDGTVLRALGQLLGSGVPTLGVNYGNVGFLAALPRRGWMEQLEPIVRGEHRVIDLLTVQTQVGGRTYTAVNDVVLSKVAPRHVLQLEYKIAGVAVGSMACDGLIVASPAGSTAYNLSCGGPVVEWGTNVLVLNFIAPHSVAFRPVVLRPDHEITARNISHSQQADVVVDGDAVARLSRDEEVRITAGGTRARLLMTAAGSFYQNVEQKLFNRRDAG